MSNVERGHNPNDHYADQILKFLNLRSVGGISRFILEEPESGKIEPNIFVALTRDAAQQVNTNIVLVVFPKDSEPFDAISLLKKIKDLKIPEEVLRLGIRDEADASFNKALFEDKGFPVAVIVLGQDLKTKKSASILYALPGISPQTALNRVQSAVKEIMIGFN